MFKKLAITILSIACVAFALAGCGGGDGDGVGVGPGPGKPVYAETQYTWNADYTQCTASKKCISNPQLSITETQNSRVISERKGNCYEMGYIEVSVEFENPELEPRTETFTTPISHEEIVDIPEKAPNCLSNGSTAGTWCESCEQYIVEPTPIPTTVTHNFVNGHCDLCNTDYFTKGLSFLPYYTQDKYYVCLENPTALEDDEVVIPAVYNGKPVVGIVDYAFENTNITSVIIPDSVTDLGMGTFRLCDYLSTVKLPSNITEIGPALFEDCESLKEIIVPTGVKTIGGSPDVTERYPIHPLRKSPDTLYSMK